MSEQYLLDGKIVNWMALIQRAEKVDPELAKQSLVRTSEAAEVLRQHGHTVEEIKS